MWGLNAIIDKFNDFSLHFLHILATECILHKKIAPAVEAEAHTCEVII